MKIGKIDLNLTGNQLTLRTDLGGHNCVKTLQNRPRNVHKSPEILLHALETIFRGTEVTIWLFEKIGEIGTFVKSAAGRFGENGILV